MTAAAPADPGHGDLGVAVIGFGWMGRVHTQAYARLRHHYPQLARHPRLIAVAEDEPERRASAVEQYGFATGVADWHDVLEDDRIAAVSVTAPNFLHREIGVAVARAGKHLWIEKPVGLDVADARAVADAVAAAGVQSTVGFNYRYAPAVQQARTLIAEGRIGTVTNARFRLFSDYAAHPQGALSWRFERSRGGNGVLGDLVSHGTDLIRFLIGDVRRLVADTAIIVAARPRATDTSSHFARATDGELAPVENEDYLTCLMQLDGGARVTLESSRVSVGDQNNYGFEIHGTQGSVQWDFRRMGELDLSLGGEYQDQSVATLFVGPGHGDFAAFQPGAGIAMGYDDLKVIEAAGFIASIAAGAPTGATIADAVRSAAILAAMTDSVRRGAWVNVADH